MSLAYPVLVQKTTGYHHGEAQAGHVAAGGFGSKSLLNGRLQASRQCSGSQALGCTVRDHCWLAFTPLTLHRSSPDLASN